MSPPANRSRPGLGGQRRVPDVDLSAVASIVTYAAIFLLPVFVQGVRGHSALATGLALLPQGIITGLSTVLGDRLLARVSVRVTVLTGFAVLTVAGLGLLAISEHTPLPVTAAILAVRAASIGLVITPLLVVVALSAAGALNALALPRVPTHLSAAAEPPVESPAAVGPGS